MKKAWLIFVCALQAAGFVFSQTGPNESIVVITKAPDSTAMGRLVEVMVDDIHRITIAVSNQQYSFNVPNGQHTVVAKAGMFSSRPIQINANSSKIEFRVVMNGFKPQLTKINETALSGGSSSSSPRTSAAGDSNSIEGAVYNAAGTLMDALPVNAVVAVLDISAQSANRELAQFAMEELTFIIVDSGDFKVVDRSSLNTIRREQNLQTSGEVDDKSAVDMGKMLGANVVIMGSISGGENRRLRLKALDVKTAEILAMASESF